MQSSAKSPADYIASLPDERRQIISDIRDAINKNIPKGFEEIMSYGMIGWVVPHSLYPAGYHCDPKTPLPFLNLASQKNHIAVYHMGLYSSPELMEWFRDGWARTSTAKLDMGKSCIRFKKIDATAIDLLGELASKITPPDWIELYENARQQQN